MNQSCVIFDHGPLDGGTCFARPSRVIRAETPDEVPAALAAMDAARAQGKWLAGLAGYELGYLFSNKLRDLLPDGRDVPLLEFGVFDGPEAAAPMLERAGAEAQGATLSAPKPVVAYDDYARVFAQVKAYIAAGDIYQANLTFPMTARMSGTALGLYGALRAKQPVPFGGFHDLGGKVVLSRSPELFFRVTDGVIETKPMKGTQPRGADAAKDDAARSFLRTDPKNRAENLMIVDLLRNDISRIARVGSVHVPELFSVETYATVHQMVSTVRADLLPDIGLRAVFEALFPCGSVTGAPKISAMQIIHELEVAPRGAYCGSIGWIAPDGDMEFNVTIRTLTMLGDGAVRLNVGGGVVHDSTAESEYEEALWKARFASL